MVDHVHFQYNGFLLGLLLLSMGLIKNVRCQPRQLKLTIDAEVKGVQGYFRNLGCSRLIFHTCHGVTAACPPQIDGGRLV